MSVFVLLVVSRSRGSASCGRQTGQLCKQWMG